MKTPTNLIISTLTKARKLITEREHWTQDAYARDEDDETIEATSEHAFSFCAVGALMNCCALDDDLFSKALEELDKAARKTDPSGIVLDGQVEHPCMTINDFRTHDKILEMYDYAISNTN